MYPFLRLGKTLIKSTIAYTQGQRLGLYDSTTLDLLANINDIDNFFEMNNGRILTLFDLGRTDFAIKTGLGKALLTERWGLVVAGSTIQYRKRVRLFDKVTIKTRLAGIDERWFYMEQSMWVNKTATSTALIRTGVTNIKTGKTLPTATVMAKLGYADEQRPLDDWLQAWIDADKLRPYPPKES